MRCVLEYAGREREGERGRIGRYLKKAIELAPINKLVIMGREHVISEKLV